MDNIKNSHSLGQKNPPLPNLMDRSHINIASNLTLNDLAKLVLFRCGSIKEFGKKLGVSRSRAYQILKGKDLPKSPEYIKRIASILDIDAVVLSICFSNADNKTQEV